VVLQWPKRFFERQAMLTDEQSRIVLNECVGPKLYRLRLDAPHIASLVQPGQFVHLKVPDFEGHVLRRPFSVYDADRSAGTLDILYQVVGQGTHKLAEAEIGTEGLSILGPVGRGWSLPAALDGPALLVGGGVGAAPLMLLAKHLLAGGGEVDVVLGAQTREALACYDDYCDAVGRAPFCSTDDGSFGFKGFCVPVAAERIAQGASSTGKPYAYLAVCGPQPLMKAVADLAAKAGIFCELSLERRMACGIGACLSCVAETEEGRLRVCVDGPVFNAREVVW
jgi:dihydroorotate dehydrogenase electron transfer subunit